MYPLRQSVGRWAVSDSCGRVLGMATLQLSDIETAVRSSWGPDTFLASEEYMAL
jgi:hypothetical protein